MLDQFMEAIGFVKVPKKEWVCPKNLLDTFLRLNHEMLATPTTLTQKNFWEWVAAQSSFERTEQCHWHMDNIKQLYCIREGIGSKWGKGYTWKRK